MSQRAALRAMDAQIMAAFVDAGMADPATYTAPGGGAAVACQAMVDRDVRLYADAGADVATAHVVVTLFLAEVSPARRGTVVVDGDTLVLDELLDQDESRSRWTVLP
jgi:hypothetical protein